MLLNRGQVSPLETTLLHGIFQAVLLWAGAGTKILPDLKKNHDQREVVGEI